MTRFEHADLAESPSDSAPPLGYLASRPRDLEDARDPMKPRPYLVTEVLDIRPQTEKTFEDGHSCSCEGSSSGDCQSPSPPPFLLPKSVVEKPLPSPPSRDSYFAPAKRGVAEDPAEPAFAVKQESDGGLRLAGGPAEEDEEPGEEEILRRRTLPPPYSSYRKGSVSS